MNQIEAGLYLGDVYDAKDIKELKKNNVTHILCAAQEASIWHPKEFTYLHLELDDEPSQDIISRFPESIEFISQGIQQGGVLVHCMMGVSRSATLVVAYLMSTRQMKVKDALQTVRRCRPCVSPNPGFQTQLLTFEQMGWEVRGNTKAHKKYKKIKKKSKRKSML